MRHYENFKPADLHDEAGVVLKFEGLVRAAARRFEGRGVERDDLLQEGRIALVRAARTFDSGRGASFATWARHCVDGAMAHAVRDTGHTIRRPGWLQEELARVAGARAELFERLHREPNAAELAAGLGIAPERLADYGRWSRPTVSLSTPLPGGGELGDTIPDAAPAVGSRMEWLDEVEGRLVELRPRESEVIRLRLGLGGDYPRTGREVARSLGLSPGRVSQLETAAVSRLSAVAA